MARIHHQTSSPATIVDLQYGYDDNHDRLYERFGGSGSPGDGFAYDKARRLTTAWMGSATPTSPSSVAYVKKIDYTMDDDGNRTDVGVTLYGQSPVSTGYTDNNLNQYTAVGGASPTYDDNGNMTYDGTLTFQYDYRNQIVKVKQGGTTVADYKYDALGRRVEKDDQSTVSRYIYSGAETVSVYDGSNAWIRDFVFGSVIDEVLMIEQADVLDYDSDMNTSETTRSFYHRNALGSVMEITDMNEAEVVSYRYDPYGAVTITVGGTPQSSDPLGNPWMYTGRFHDEETGLEYYRARYYSTTIGRFLQRDPLGYAPGPNAYEYAKSAPAVHRDPLGLHYDPRLRGRPQRDPGYLNPGEIDPVRGNGMYVDEHGSGYIDPDPFPGWVHWCWDNTVGTVADVAEGVDGLGAVAGGLLGGGDKTCYCTVRLKKTGTLMTQGPIDMPCRTDKQCTKMCRVAKAVINAVMGKKFNMKVTVKGTCM